jgi:hypothetical protein
VIIRIARGKGGADHFAMLSVQSTVKNAGSGGRGGGAPERSPKAGVGAASGVEWNGPKRFSVQRKMAIVARLLRGEP